MKLSVCAFIINPNNPDLYLGVSRKYNHNDFGLPGGKVDEGETLEEALIREVKEETGLTVISYKSIFEYVVPGEINYYCYTYQCDFIGEIHTDEKGVVKWVSKEELLAGCFGDYNKRLFDKLSTSNETGENK